MTNDPIDPLRDWFVGFEGHAPSLLYRRLSGAVADAPDVLALLLHARPAQRTPMLLFAAVHSVILDRGEPYPGDGPAFVAFCRANADTLEPILRDRATQTNDVGRCGYLRPCLAAAADGRPLALIEVGASAGLNLNLDRYGYRLGDEPVIGDASSPVQVVTELLSGRPPMALPAIAWRCGIDLNPAPDADWLRACIFADQPERRARLDAALEIAAAHPPPLIKGDALDLLPSVLAGIPDGLQPVVLHTAVAIYLTAAERAHLDNLLSDVTHIAAEDGHPDGGFILHVDGRDVGRADPHGRWLRWDDEG